MPTYEFECTDCGDRFDIFLSISEPQPTHCAKCRGKLQKVFHPIGIMFKGSGFYVNDNKSATNGAAIPLSVKADKTIENTPVNGAPDPDPVHSATETMAGSDGK